MDVQVKWNGAYITNSVIEYSREQDICTGFGTIDMTVESKTARDFQPWDKIIIYENGDKMAEYNIAMAEEKIPGLVYVVSCQDDSKRLTDYFIDTQYTINYPSTAKYWIEKFLTDAGVTYSINATGSGSELSDNTTLGISTAYDAILQLLQMSGWYFYFDENNVCQIGSLSVNGSSVHNFSGDTILEIGYIKNDKLLRNRVVVWGASDKDGHWIYADTSTKTAWNRPDGDYRTVVYTNSAIKTIGAAFSLAKKILTEFSQTIPEKGIKVVSSYSDITLGKRIYGTTRTLSEGGMVTHILVNMSSEGLVSTYTLDRRCPRLFGYYQWLDYVYIGTEGKGVWRKFITSPTWNNYSTGITDLNIKDLSAYDGLLGAISTTISGEEGKINPIIDSQLWVRHTSLGAWSGYNPVGFTDYTASGGPVFLTSGIIAEACSIDRNIGVTGAITVGYTIPGSGKWIGSGEYYAPSGNLSWVQAVTVDRVPVYTQQVVATSGIYKGFSSSDIAIIDMDTNYDGYNLISAFNSKTKYGPIIPPTSGSSVPYNYRGPVCTIGGQPGLSTFVDIAFHTGAGNILTVCPPPTSGIVIEQTSIYYEDYPFSGGYWILPATVGAVGGAIITDDDEYDGHLYGFGLGVLGAYHFTLASGIWNDGDKVWEGFYQGGDYNMGGIIISSGDIGGSFFNKIGNNSFSLVRTNWAGGTGVNFNVKTHILHTVDAPSGIYAGYVVQDSLVDSSFSSEYSRTQTSYLWGPERKGGNGYVGILYNEETDIDSGIFRYKFKVIDARDGSTKSDETITTTYEDFYDCICKVIYTYESSHYAYFGFVKCAPGTLPGEIWDGIHYYPILMNKDTGDVTWQEIKANISIPTGIGIGVHHVNWINDGSLQPHYRFWFYYPTNENPDTGAGFGHFYFKVRITYDFPDPIDDIIYNICVDSIINTDGSVAEKIYYDPEIDGEIIVNSPEWMWGVEDYGFSWGSNILNPTFSRYGNTPVVIFYYGNPHDIPYLVDPYDFSKVVGSIPTWEDYDNFIRLFPMPDDVDDSLYFSISKVAGTEGQSVTVASDYAGNVRKVLFPKRTDFQDYIIGQPLDNKIYGIYGYAGDETDYVTAFNFIPRVMVSGLYREASRYFILKHDYKIEPSGLFDIIYQGGVPLAIDTSKSLPTVIYDRLYTETTSGRTNSNFMGFSYINEDRSFNTSYPATPLYDVRTFDLDSTTSLIPLNTEIGRFIGAAAGHLGLVMFGTEPGNNEHIHIISGAFTHLDFTNNFVDPYIFVCTSGISPVDSGRFFQRDSETFIWNDYSNTLPSGVEITIIRADDRM